MSTDDSGYEVPSGVDPTKPSAGRMYDFYLNGRLHTEVDRAAARKILEVIPETHYLANANRVFLQRAVGVMARAGIRQFIDVGAGLPTQWNTHEVAQVVDPSARVVYVDNDAMVLAEARDILQRRGETNVVYTEGDIRNPEGILDNPDVRERIDFSQPIGYVHVAIWHFVPDELDPFGLLQKFMDAVPSGSYLALSHGTADGQRPEKIQRWWDVYSQASAQLHLRPRTDIERFFTGLEYLPPYEGAEPGLSYIDVWGSKNPASADPAHSWIPCGVARKP